VRGRAFKKTRVREFAFGTLHVSLVSAMEDTDTSDILGSRPASKGRIPLATLTLHDTAMTISARERAPS
jgi:hypothetical protein